MPLGAHSGLPGQQTGCLVCRVGWGDVRGRAASSLLRGCALIWLLMGPKASAPQQEHSHFCGPHSSCTWSIPTNDRHLNPDCLEPKTFCVRPLTRYSQTCPARSCYEVGTGVVTQKWRPRLVSSRAAVPLWGVMEGWGTHAFSSLLALGL